VQTIQPFYSTGGQLKLTTATYWRPSGRNINRTKAERNDDDTDEWGVTPNPGFTVKLGAKELNDLAEFQRANEIIHQPGYKAPENKVEFKDRQLDSAINYLRGQIKMASKVAGGSKKKAG